MAIPTCAYTGWRELEACGKEDRDSLRPCFLPSSRLLMNSRSLFVLSLYLYITSFGIVGALRHHHGSTTSAQFPMSPASSRMPHSKHLLAFQMSSSRPASLLSTSSTIISPPSTSSIKSWSAPSSSTTLSSNKSSSAGSSNDHDYDLVIIGCGVGGHGAALHAKANGLKTAILTGGDVGGTCVNRGCVPSKALLAAAGKVRELTNKDHLKRFGIEINDANFDRKKVVDHAKQLAEKVRGGLLGSLKGHGIDVLDGKGVLVGENEIMLSGGPGERTEKLRAKNIILAPGSIPFVPPGIQVDEKTVFTSDGGVSMDRKMDHVAIIGSGYIGLEFLDVFTSLGSEVTLIEALDKLMPGFDPEIAKLAERLLLKPRGVDTRVGVLAQEVIPGIEGSRPVTVKLVNAKTKEFVGVLEVDGCMVATGRVPNTKGLGLDKLGVELLRGGFVPVDETMRVKRSNATENSSSESFPSLFCIGDANGKLMLAHAASAQGISAVENICGRYHEVNHPSIPAACFTHPEISFVGLTEEQALQKGKNENFEVGKATSHFRANSKALAEGEGEGMVKVLFNKTTGELLGVHIIGIHASDLIQEAANAMVARTPVQQLAFMVHTHPTLAEVMDGAFKTAVGMNAH